MASNGNMDYPKITKQSFVLGFILFLFGALGEGLIHMMGLQVPGWEQILLFDIEVLGIGIMLLSPLIFGIFLPLTE
jgi:hypothetical protein